MSSLCRPLMKWCKQNVQCDLTTMKYVIRMKYASRKNKMFVQHISAISNLFKYYIVNHLNFHIFWRLYFRSLSYILKTVFPKKFMCHILYISTWLWQHAINKTCKGIWFKKTVKNVPTFFYTFLNLMRHIHPFFLEERRVKVFKKNLYSNQLDRVFYHVAKR